jgi:PAS domain S-box-containing protein
MSSPGDPDELAMESASRTYPAYTSYKSSKATLLKANLPVIVTLICIGLSVFFWNMCKNHESAQIRQSTEIHAQNAGLEISERLDQFASALQRMGTRLEYLGIQDKKFLELDSKSYLDNLVGLKRLGLTDTHYKVTWSYPNDLNQQVVNFDQSTDLTRKSAFDFALANRHFTMSQSIELRSGGAGFLIPVPLFFEQDFSGFLYGTIDSKLFFSQIKSFAGYQVSIRDDFHEIFANSVSAPQDKTSWKAERKLSWGQTTLSIEIVPSIENIKSHQSPLINIVFTLSLLFSVLMGLFAQLLAFSKEQASQITAAENLYRLVIDSAKDYAIFVLDTNGQVMTWNDGAKNLKGYTSEEIIGKHFSIFYPKNAETKDKCRELIQKVNQFGQVEDEGWRICKNGKRIWAHVTISKIIDEHGNLIGYSKITKDLSAQRRVQLALQESKEFLSTTSARARLTFLLPVGFSSGYRRMRRT